MKVKPRLLHSRHDSLILSHHKKHIEITLHRQVIQITLDNKFLDLTFDEFYDFLNTLKEKP